MSGIYNNEAIIGGEPGDNSAGMASQNAPVKKEQHDIQEQEIMATTENKKPVRLINKRLPDGTQLYVYHLPKCKDVSVGFVTMAGSADEDIAQAGIMHALEHGVFNQALPERAPFVVANRIGAVLNAFTTKDLTCFHGTASPQMWPRLLELEYIMWNDAFPDSMDTLYNLSDLAPQSRLNQLVKEDYSINNFNEDTPELRKQMAKAKKEDTGDKDVDTEDQVDEGDDEWNAVGTEEAAAVAHPDSAMGVKKFLTELGPILSEYLGTLDNPGCQKEMFIGRTVFGEEGAYAIPTIGTIDSLSNLELPFLRQMHRDHYQKGKLAITVVGDLSHFVKTEKDFMKIYDDMRGEVYVPTARQNTFIPYTPTEDFNTVPINVGNLATKAEFANITGKAGGTEYALISSSHEIVIVYFGPGKIFFITHPKLSLQTDEICGGLAEMYNGGVGHILYDEFVAHKLAFDATYDFEINNNATLHIFTFKIGNKGVGSEDLPQKGAVIKRKLDEIFHIPIADGRELDVKRMALMKEFEKENEKIKGEQQVLKKELEELQKDAKDEIIEQLAASYKEAPDFATIMETVHEFIYSKILYTHYKMKGNGAAVKEIYTNIEAVWKDVKDRQAIQDKIKEIDALNLAIKRVDSMSREERYEIYQKKKKWIEIYFLDTSFLEHDNIKRSSEDMLTTLANRGIRMMPVEFPADAPNQFMSVFGTDDNYADPLWLMFQDREARAHHLEEMISIINDYTKRIDDANYSDYSFVLAQNSEAEDLTEVTTLMTTYKSVQDWASQRIYKGDDATGYESLDADVHIPAHPDNLETMEVKYEFFRDKAYVVLHENTDQFVVAIGWNHHRAMEHSMWGYLIDMYAFMVLEHRVGLRKDSSFKDWLTDNACQASFSASNITLVFTPSVHKMNTKGDNMDKNDSWISGTLREAISHLVDSLHLIEWRHLDELFPIAKQQFMDKIEALKMNREEKVNEFLRDELYPKKDPANKNEINYWDYNLQTMMDFLDGIGNDMSQMKSYFFRLFGNRDDMALVITIPKGANQETILSYSLALFGKYHYAKVDEKKEAQLATAFTQDAFDPLLWKKLQSKNISIKMPFLKNQEFVIAVRPSRFMLSRDTLKEYVMEQIVAILEGGPMGMKPWMMRYVGNLYWLRMKMGMEFFSDKGLDMLTISTRAANIDEVRSEASNMLLVGVNKKGKYMPNITKVKTPVNINSISAYLNSPMLAWMVNAAAVIYTNRIRDQYQDVVGRTHLVLKSITDKLELNFHVSMYDEAKKLQSRPLDVNDFIQERKLKVHDHWFFFTVQKNGSYDRDAELLAEQEAQKRDMAEGGDGN
jgi:hypothetical protein